MLGQAECRSRWVEAFERFTCQTCWDGLVEVKTGEAAFVYATRVNVEDSTRRTPTDRVWSDPLFLPLRRVWTDLVTTRACRWKARKPHSSRRP